MLLEALELLQSAGDDENTYVTDFALYKVVTILTIYGPIMVATFLLSQEYLGEKIACFAPENFTDSQAQALNEFCWNNGLWVDQAEVHVKSFYTQPHRYFAFYLVLQAILCTTPVIAWNILLKSHLLAILRGTEEFFESLIDMINEAKTEEMDSERLADNVKNQLKHFHHVCLNAARTSRLSHVLIGRQSWETILFLSLIIFQFAIFNRNDKYFVCEIIDMTQKSIYCTVPVLDLLDFIWKLNLGLLSVAAAIILFSIQSEFRSHFGQYQPMFINDLPYGDEDDFNENVAWRNNFTKHSYELLTMLFEENNAIMTKVYVLNAMKPMVQQTTQDLGQKIQKQTPTARNQVEAEFNHGGMEKIADKDGLRKRFITMD